MSTTAQQKTKALKIVRNATHIQGGCAFIAGGVDCPWGCVPSKPRMALRPYGDDEERLDDIVIHDVKMFRAEMMDEGSLWMACYFDEAADTAISFAITAGRRASAQLRVVATDTPDYIDIDKERRSQ